MNLSTLEYPPTAAQVAKRPESNSNRNFLIGALLIALLGIALRVIPSAGFSGLGFDESLYRNYILMLDRQGISNYSVLTEVFLDDQRKPDSITKLPPTRFLYIFSGWVWKHAQFGDAPPADLHERGALARDPALRSLENVASLFAVLLMLTAAAAAWRMFGPTTGLGVMALVAFSPVLIHMGQHALIDGFFAFWATLCLWALWENLRKPNHSGWLTVYGLSLALMVMTKENSFFVFCALCGLLIANRWGMWGEATPRLLLVMVAGPLLGLAVLVTLAGGLPNFIETYRLLVSKAQNLQYAIRTGDGPWYRYLVDLLVVNPLVLCLAIGGAFQLPKQNRTYWYLLAFMAFSYLIMCNVRYGMNLRYTTIWELPLSVFAFGQLALLTRGAGRRQPLFLIVLTTALCAYGLRQYLIFFSDARLYELVPEGLLRAVRILK